MMNFDEMHVLTYNFHIKQSLSEFLFCTQTRH